LKGVFAVPIQYGYVPEPAATGKELKEAAGELDREGYGVDRQQLQQLGKN
jgi:hypothetical protein